MQCAKHPDVDTMVRCGRCETPVCPKCSVFGPAGIRCKECAGWRSTHVYQVAPHALARSGAACAVAGVLGGALLAAVGGIGFFALWAGILVGAGIGECALRTSGQKRGTAMEVIAGTSAVLGSLLGVALYLTLKGWGGPAALPAFLSSHIFLSLSIVAAGFVAVSRVRVW